MSDQEVKSNESDIAADRIARLEKRLAREKAARKEAEAIAEQGMRDLFLANRDLDAQVSERTEELDTEVLKSAKAADERLLFLGALSRQVRTPLNGVSGMLELLASQDLDNQSMIWLNSAQVSSQYLLRLFTRLALYMELTDSGEVAAIEINVASVISETAEIWGPKCLTAGQLLVTDNQIDTELKIVARPTLLEALLGEVVDNVVRHGVPGPVHFSAEIADDTVLISVSDSGPGIQDPDRLLQSSESSTVFTETLGMGYALIQKLAAGLGATVTQTTGSATSVTIEIPIGDVAS